MTLEQLEIVETKYVSPFRITERSMTDLSSAPVSGTGGIASISRARVLAGSSVRRWCSSFSLFSFLIEIFCRQFVGEGGRNPTDASYSLSPKPYLAPRYKLGIRDINGGRFADDDARISFSCQSSLTGVS